MESSAGNANYYCTLPSPTAADDDDDDLIYYSNSASLNYNSTNANCISEGSPLIPVIVSDFPCPLTISYFSYCDIYPQINQMRRLNEEVDPNGLQRPLFDAADTSMVNSISADLENSSPLVISIPEQHVYQQDSGMFIHHQFANTHQNPADPEVLKSAASFRCRNPASSTGNQKTSFGLHLNTIAAGSMALNSAAILSMEAADKDCYGLQTNNHLLIASSSEPTESGMPNVVKPVSEYEGSDLGKAPLEPDMNQVNGQNKRKKVDENDGCKRCKCKKSKCLKLYCDCFAAGVYCADSCACQGCFNKPIYENTVVETRQQIKSRNPFAFSPKVVKQYATSAAPNNGDKVNLSTADSGRHKRGCNCKKSLCQKKYCECYEGNVGCSLECRCEGCQNIFGKKEDYKLTKDAVLDQNIIESNNVTQNEQTHNTPSLAPSFQHIGSNVGGNQHATTSPNESFGIPVSTINQSQMAVTSSSNLIYPENDCFPFTVFPQLCGSQTHISQFNGMKAQYAAESDNTIQRDSTPDILKDNFYHISNSANVMSPRNKRVSPPYIAQGIERGSSSVSVMRSSRNFNMFPLPPIVPMNDDGRHQTSFPPLMSCNDNNMPQGYI